jgi:beta-galactosidase
MPTISFTPDCYRIDGKPGYLVCGEFHYFRVPKSDWQRRMQLFKEAGGNCLATYIPWLLHEPEEGTFCFGEAAEWLDLEDFLQTAQALELPVIARPGPYQYSELVYDGLPGWLCERYPQLLARDFHGNVFRKSSVSYLHPLFLEKTGRWFDVVCPILNRYTVQNSGPIAFVQLDNEMAGIHQWFSGLDYHPETMGFGRADGRFARFLENRYQSLKALNQAYQTRYRSFGAIKPPDPAAEHSLADLRRKKDYFDFYLATLAEFADWLAKRIRQHGIEVPLIHNAANPEMNAYFLETVQVLGKGFILGSDHYYNLDQSWKQNNPTPQYAARVFYSLEMLRLMGFPPTVLELPGGSASDWPPVTPEDAQACYFTNLALGMKGSNYYIFTGGPNPPGAGATTDIYDFTAAIGPQGEVRPLYRAQQAFGEFLQAHAWLAAGERVGDVRFTLDFEQARAERYWAAQGGALFSGTAAWDFWLTGPLTTAFCASLSPTLCNLDSEAWLEDRSTPLVVVCASAMSAAKQERLVRFLQSGGKALFLPTLPSLDEAFNPCTLLADFLGKPATNANPDGRIRAVIAGVMNVLGRATLFDNLPPGSEVLGTDEFSGRVIAWKKSFPGGGAAVVLGFHWKHSMREHERMLVNLLANLGLQQVVRCSNPNVWTSLWRADTRMGLFIMNLLTAPMQAHITLQPSPQSSPLDAGTHSLGPISVKWVEVHKSEP